MTAPTPSHVRELRCPACNRYLGAMDQDGPAPSVGLWLRLRCQNCRKWVRIDPVEGRVREEREKVPA